MTSNVELRNPASAMLDYEEAIQELECQGGHGEEVEGDDHLAVILEEGRPAMIGITSTTNAPQVSRHGAPDVSKSGSRQGGGVWLSLTYSRA